MKTSELTGAALDWAVEVALLSDRIKNVEQRAAIASRNRRVSEAGYATNWAFGGPIIERERIAIALVYEPSMVYDDDCRWKAQDPMTDTENVYGPTPLVAAMRYYVASKLGDAVEIPEELR